MCILELNIQILNRQIEIVVTLTLTKMIQIESLAFLSLKSVSHVLEEPLKVLTRSIMLVFSQSRKLTLHILLPKPTQDNESTNFMIKYLS